MHTRPPFKQIPFRLDSFRVQTSGVFIRDVKVDFRILRQIQLAYQAAIFTILFVQPSSQHFGAFTRDVEVDFRMFEANFRFTVGELV